MPSNSTGKWVERAATTGGGRTYRGQMPVNWYASLVLICVVGLLLVGFSRYQRTHQTASSAGPPTTSRTGTPPSASTSAARCSPTFRPAPTPRQDRPRRQRQRRGDHRPEEQLGVRRQRHARQVRLRLQGPRADSSTLQYPGKPAHDQRRRLPEGDARRRQARVVIVESWPNFTAKGKGTETSGAPQDLLFANGQLITMAFVPATAAVPKPPAAAITALIQAVTSGTRVDPSTTTPTLTPSTHVTDFDHGDAPRRPASESRRPGGRRGHPPAAADAHRPRSRCCRSSRSR